MVGVVGGRAEEGSKRVEIDFMFSSSGYVVCDASSKNKYKNVLSNDVYNL